jgi:hypothetical protein
LSGRVIREYVYEGWNVDAAGRRVCDAVHTHTGSGRLFQNQRFAQVGRYPRQHEEHQWPAEYYRARSQGSHLWQTQVTALSVSRS